MTAVRASVLIPTHDHATTLPLTVGSVLRQRVADLEVLLVGDGVTDANRQAIEQLVEEDPRVRFLDFPKGPHHGEIYRHEAILAARSDAILYLCDDDLLLPDHVGDLLALLEGADFVQSRNGFIRPDGSMGLHPADLSDPRCIAWHLAPEPRRNAVSITGTGHSRAFYLEVGDPWETTPADEWPDHYQWKKLFRHPDFRGATSHRMTALQFPTSQDDRDRWSPEERYDELVRWADLVARPDAQACIDALVDHATQQALARSVLDLDQARSAGAAREAHNHQLHLLVEKQRERTRQLRDRLRRSRHRRTRAEARLTSIEQSRSWRVTAPLRALRARGRSR